MGKPIASASIKAKDHSLESCYSTLRPTMDLLSNNIVDIYVDGSFRNGNYSYGFVVVKNGAVIHGGKGLGQNQLAAKMHNVAGELSGAMQAVRWAKQNNYKCIIHHDYEGVGKWPKRQWKTKNEFTQAYVAYMDKYKEVIVDFKWVKGHAGNKYNTLADQLAAEAFCMENETK